MATTNASRSKELEALVQRLSRKVDKLQSQLLEAQKELEAVTMTMNLLERGSADTQSDTTQMEDQVDAYLDEFKGMTQVQALVKFAKDNGNNRFKISEAKRLLTMAGLIKSKKNASNIIFNAIQRSEKFKRVAPGEYELIAKQQPITLLEASR